MEDLHLSVIPAQAGIPWHQVLRDSRFRGSDGHCAFFDTLRGGEGIAAATLSSPLRGGEYQGEGCQLSNDQMRSY
jgi:hypothetical protein